MSDCAPDSILPPGLTTKLAADFCGDVRVAAMKCLARILSTVFLILEATLRVTDRAGNSRALIGIETAEIESVLLVALVGG